MSSTDQPVPPAPLPYRDEELAEWRRDMWYRTGGYNERVMRLDATIAERDKRLAAVKDVCTDIMQDVVPSWLDGEMDDWQFTGIGIACEVFSAAEGRTP